MISIFLPIKPVHARKIISGTKFYEYRKVLPSRNVNKIVIYASSPQKCILGIADVEFILSGTPKDIWYETKDGAGIDEDFFYKYFHGKKVAYALKLFSVKRLRNEVSPTSFWKEFKIPQSFVYLKSSRYSEIASLPYETV